MVLGAAYLLLLLPDYLTILGDLLGPEREHLAGRRLA